MKELCKDAMMLPVVIETVFDVLSHKVFNDKKR